MDYYLRNSVSKQLTELWKVGQIHINFQLFTIYYWSLFSLLPALGTIPLKNSVPQLSNKFKINVETNIEISKRQRTSFIAPCVQYIFHAKLLLRLLKWKLLQFKVTAVLIYWLYLFKNVIWFPILSQGGSRHVTMSPVGHWWKWRKGERSNSMFWMFLCCK